MAQLAEHRSPKPRVAGSIPASPAENLRRDEYRRMIKKIKGIPGFFKEVKEELKKVSWSSRHELMAAATVVVIITSLLTAYIAFVDLGLSRLVQILLR